MRAALLELIFEPRVEPDEDAAASPHGDDLHCEAVEQPFHLAERHLRRNPRRPGFHSAVLFETVVRRGPSTAPAPLLGLGPGEGVVDFLLVQTDA